MKITKNAPPPPPQPTYAIECNLDELKLLRQLIGASTGADDRKAGVPVDTGWEMFQAIDAHVSVTCSPR